MVDVFSGHRRRHTKFILLSRDAAGSSRRRIPNCAKASNIGESFSQYDMCLFFWGMG